LPRVEELGLAVPVIALIGYRTGGHLKSGEQRGGAIALVVVGPLLRQARSQRQERGGPVQGLDLGLLIHAQHDRLLRRVQVQPDHVADLGLQLRVGGELERLPPPRLDPVLAPGAGHSGIPDPQVLAQ
jgi:hypothetical protein